VEGKKQKQREETKTFSVSPPLDTGKSNSGRGTSRGGQPEQKSIIFLRRCRLWEGNLLGGREVLSNRRAGTESQMSKPKRRWDRHRRRSSAVRLAIERSKPRGKKKTDEGIAGSSLPLYTRLRGKGGRGPDRESIRVQKGDCGRRKGHSPRNERSTYLGTVHCQGGGKKREQEDRVANNLKRPRSMKQEEILFLKTKERDVKKKSLPEDTPSASKFLAIFLGF